MARPSVCRCEFQQVEKEYMDKKRPGEGFSSSGYESFRRTNQLHVSVARAQHG